MGQLMKNGVPYGGLDINAVTNAYLAGRAYSDENGDELVETYGKLADYNSRQNLEMDDGLIAIMSAGTHNSIFRGKDISDYFEDGSLFTRIEDGSFEDLWVGDYFTITYNETKMNMRIAGFNIYANNELLGKKNHAVIVPDTSFISSGMNTSNTTTGGYGNSNMRTTVLPEIQTKLEEILGDHMLTIKDFITTEVNTSIVSNGYNGWKGASSNGEYMDSKLDLMTEIEVYGTRIWSSSALDVKSGNKQFPLFALAPRYVNPGRFNWWLRCVVCSTLFAAVSGDGSASCNGASCSYGVRPRFIID
jgi:hypothetical protein